MSPSKHQTNWTASQKIGLDMSDEEWTDLGVLVKAKTPPNERPSIGRFIAETVRTTYRDELALIARQRKELAERLKGA